MDTPARHWPLFGLRLRGGGLVLRPVTEADLDELADRLPVDVELDPRLPSYPGLTPGAGRRAALCQSYWRALGGWTVESWSLQFLVLLDGELIGTQSLEGEDFLRLRTVDSASYLQPAARGRGLGVAMRRAVLALAFGHLGAEAAVTSAWHDNAASLGVSRSLGYEPNGVSLHSRGDGADLMVHLRLTRQRWVEVNGSPSVSVEGLDAGRALFGLGSVQP